MDTGENEGLEGFPPLPGRSHIHSGSRAPG